MHERTSTLQLINTCLGKKLETVFFILCKTVCISDHLKEKTLISPGLVGLGCPPTCRGVTLRSCCQLSCHICLSVLLTPPLEKCGWPSQPDRCFFPPLHSRRLQHGLFQPGGGGAVRVMGTGHTFFAYMVGLWCLPNVME